MHEIYNQYSIIKCYLYLKLTNTDNISFLFMFVCEIDCSIKESEARWFVLIILSKSEIRERSDSSDEFYKKFSIHDGNLKKKWFFMK